MDGISTTGSTVGSSALQQRQTHEDLIMADAGGVGNVLRARHQKDDFFDAAGRGDTAFFEDLSEQDLLRCRDFVNEDGRTVLHVAAAAGHAQVVSVLCDGLAASESGVNAADEEGWTPLHSAVSSGKAAVATALLQAGADIHATNAGGRTCLHYAASKGQADIASQLIARGARINKKDKMGCTPLHRAASAGHLEVADILIEEGAEVDAVDNEDQTPLMLATICGNSQNPKLADCKWEILYTSEEVALLLVRHGADVDAQDKEGFTVLGRASDDLRPAIIDTAKAMMEG